MDSREALLHGGDSGKAIVPGDLEASLFWTAVTWADEDYEMPPRRKLPQDVVADIQKWIEMGAPDPRVTETVVVDTKIDMEEGRQFWSFQPPAKAPAPEISSPEWAETEVDQFVRAGLEAKGLQPVGEARADVLLRRLNFDLIGLPPSPEEVIAFVKAYRQDSKTALEAKVDELLARPEFGERWGRHWLDVARYAESTGKDINMLYPEAWRYRDYVIDSFNADKPYNRFIQEQIAGDLLPIKNDADWQENLIATGFLAIGTKGLNERDNRQFLLDVADEQIDTMSQAFLGLTVSCARCHDHKSDPIPTADYYSMAGIFLSTETFFGTTNVLINRRATDLLLLPIADSNPMGSMTPEALEQVRARLKSTQAELAEFRAQQAQIRRQAMMGNNTMTEGRNNDVNTALRLNSQIAFLEGQLNGVQADGTAKTLAMGVQDRDRVIEGTILVRGELDKPAQTVPRGFLQVLDHIETGELPADGSGRLQLAQWLSSEENPLTARVMVNRIWMQLFGAGLVTSLDNFGVTGQTPSHPELLDHLAVSFMENDWSIKSLIRDLVLTRTYRLSSEFDSANYAQDPENTFLWRGAPRRLDAEALRDAILVASGELDPDRPHGSMVAEKGNAFGPRLNMDDFNRPVTYRSVYLPIVRNAVPDSLAIFDGADPNIVNGMRDQTNVPSQALYLLNNPFLVQQGEAMARRIIAEADEPRARFESAFFIAYGRPATRDEADSAMNYFRSFLPVAMKETGNRDRAGFLALSTFCQGLMASAEFRFLN